MSNDWSGHDGGSQHHAQGAQQPYPTTGNYPTAQVPPGQVPPGGGPPGYGGGPGNGSGKGKGRRPAMIVGLLVTVTGLLVGGGLVLVNRSSNDAPIENATYVIMDELTANVQPVFEPRDARGSDPFFPLEVQLASFQEDAMDEAMSVAKSQGGDGEQVDPADFRVERLTEQTKTGLYGGTAENTCDPEQLIAFLIENPELGQAWAQVQGIAFAEIPSYIRGLEVRVLAAPVEVLNHGYNEITGQAYELDTTLDTGTAVLVDADGHVRTRCYCGNPIRPKPPTRQTPPACLSIPYQVFLAPDDSMRRSNVPSTVFTTGRIATYEGRTWTEVMWGTEANQMGWTLQINLQARVYCRPVTPHPKCPTAVGVPVYETAESTEKYGQVGVSPDSPQLGGARIIPVSATAEGEQVVVNDRLLIHFSHPNKISKSAWIDLTDVDSEADPADCEPYRACVDFPDAPTKPALEGPIPGVGAGQHRVEFTGHFVVTPGAGGANVVYAEINLLEQGNQKAWVILDGAVVLADDACAGPTTLCKAPSPELGDNVLWSSPTASFDFSELDGATASADIPLQDFSVVLGVAWSVDVTLVGSAVPTNGRIEVQLGSGGPIGWIEVSTLTGDYCRPDEICATLANPVFSDFRDTGSVLPGTPGGPQLIRHYHTIVFVHDQSDPAPPTNPDDFYLHLEVGGARGWAPTTSFLNGVDDVCTPPPPPTCPQTSVSATAAATTNASCCVAYENATALVALTGRTETRGGIDYLEVMIDGGPPFWVASAAFTDGAICYTPPVACPVLPTGSSRTSEDLRCCAVVDGDEGFDFIEVTLTGETFDVDGATAFQTVANGPINEADFVSSDSCTELPPETPACEGGLIEVRPGVCCERGQQVVAGQCTTPCPQGQIRSGAGTCYTPCPTGQQRANNGTCYTPCPNGSQPGANGCSATPAPCPSGQTRATSGTCYTPCPDGTQPTGDGCPDTEVSCPAGQVVVARDRCCPRGTELLANQCVTPCAEGETRGTDGRCSIDCPQGQLNLVRQCCPSNTRPTGQGSCSSPCTTERDRLDTCCPSGQTIDAQTQLCTNPCPTNRQAANGSCCAQSEEVVNGQCELFCSTVRDSFGECCASGFVNTGTGRCVPVCPSGQVLNANLQCEAECPSGVIAPTNNECCASGEVIDPGGFCNAPCAGNNFNTQTGDCCPAGSEPVGTSCARLCPSDSDRDTLGECCPVRNPQTPAEINNQGICEYFA